MTQVLVTLRCPSPHPWRLRVGEAGIVKDRSQRWLIEQSAIQLFALAAGKDSGHMLKEGYWLVGRMLPSWTLAQQLHVTHQKDTRQSPLRATPTMLSLKL